LQLAGVLEELQRLSNRGPHLIKNRAEASGELRSAIAGHRLPFRFLITASRRDVKFATPVHPEQDRDRIAERSNPSVIGNAATATATI